MNSPDETYGETRDGDGAGDCNREYHFGFKLSTRDHWVFSDRVFARLLCLRSHVQDGERKPSESDLAATRDE